MVHFFLSDEQYHGNILKDDSFQTFKKNSDFQKKILKTANV